MDDIKILICGNVIKNEIINIIENLNLSHNLNLFIEDLSKNTNKQNIEYYFSLINNIQYFNVFILNFDKKEDIFDFFKSLNSEEYGITNECYPFFLINEDLLAKPETKEFIVDLNKSKENEYKIRLENFLFYNKKNINDFKSMFINIYNCYKQESKKLNDGGDEEESLNILLIGLKNVGKSFLINRFLGETRALSMENHYTSKFNSYRHRKYPIVFYDISGFNENEDKEIKDFNSKIDEFNKEYQNIKNKIHIILYVIDCNSVRILQDKEKKLIETIFDINIPIFIVGQKAKVTNKNNFMRKIKVELDSFSEKYKEKIKSLSKRIVCLDSSKESYDDLLDKIYDEIYKSQEINNYIIYDYSFIDDDELLNLDFTENFNLAKFKEDEKKVSGIYNYVKDSIFFNDFIETTKEVHRNITKIEETYLKDDYYFKNLKTEKLYGEIEKEFLKFFPKEDLDKINNMIKKHEKELNFDNKNLIKAGFKKGAYMSISLSVTAVLTTIGWLAPLGSLAIGTAAYPIINDNVTKSNIKDKFKDIINTYEILRWNYIKMNLQTIKKKAEIYNDIINKFSQYIVDFKKNYFFD
jgi:GTP-binding protein EngB required for normal cell division